MKDLRRWGMGLIMAMLVLSMSTSIAMGTTVGSRGGSDRPTDDGGGEGSGLIDGLGEPDWGGGRNLPYTEPDYFVLSLKVSLNRLGFRFPIWMARPAAREVEMSRSRLAGARR